MAVRAVMEATADLEGRQQCIDLHNNPAGLGNQLQFCSRYQFQCTWKSNCKHQPTQCVKICCKSCNRAVCFSGLEPIDGSSDPSILHCRTKVHRFFKTKPPHLYEVYGVYYSGSLPLCLLQPSGAFCTVFEVDQANAPILDRTVSSSMLCMPGSCGVAHKSCAANQCCRRTCTRAGESMILLGFRKMHLLPPNRSTRTAPIIAQSYGK